jgi:hypothetical protein
MTLVCSLVLPCGFARAEVPAPLWNNTWSNLEAQWSVEFDHLLADIQNRQFEQAWPRVDVLASLLAKMNVNAQQSFSARERETWRALRRIIIDDSIRIAGAREFFDEAQQDLLTVYLSALVRTAGNSTQLRDLIKKEYWSQLWRRAGANALIGLGTGGLTTGGMAIQTPTSLTIGTMVGALATYKLWQTLPSRMSGRPNLVGPMIEECRKRLTK